MRPVSATARAWFGRRSLIGLVILLALVVFVMTWLGIHASRQDSFKLLVTQGAAFIESLALAAENAIASESFIDYLVHRRFNEITLFLSDVLMEGDVDSRLTQTALKHNLHAIYILDLEGEVRHRGVARTSGSFLPDYVIAEAQTLASRPEDKYLLLLENPDQSAETIHYYIEISNTLNHIFVIVADALYYTDALRQTQIGYLVQNMAREPGVAYIIYQSTEGIVFSSRETGRLLAIESDPFLTAALETDTISHRKYVFQGDEVLELLRPFATEEYPFGLFRVGLSLTNYYAVVRRFDRQMIAVAVILFGLVALSILYAGSRQKRMEISRKYTEIKSVTDTIFDQMRTGVAAVNHEGTVTLVNEAFARIWGVREARGQRWNSLVDVTELQFERLSEWPGRTEEREVTIRAAGSEKTLLIAVSEFTVDQRQSGFVVVIYDITRLKQYERDAVRRERLSEMGNLAAGVAHEIRNPLNTISIAAQRLGTEFSPTEDTEAYQSLTAQIRSETKRLNEIITRFLALAREERKRQSRIELQPFIDEVVDFVKVEAEQQHIEITTEVEPNLFLQADPDSLKQVFTNLFNNTKEALAGNSGEIRISAHKVDNTVELRFSDSGPGIKDELREKVFTPYFTTKEGGTGLGLPTVHRIVSEIGGSVHIEDNKEGGGISFVIEISQ